MAAIWLNPRTNVVVNVIGSGHEIMLALPHVQEQLNVRPNFREKIMEYVNNGGHAKWSQEIKLLGIKAGLVRIREYKRQGVAEFFARPHEVESFLWAIEEQVKTTFDHLSSIRINNIKSGDTIDISKQDFLSMMQKGQKVVEQFDALVEKKGLKRYKAFMEEGR